MIDAPSEGGRDARGYGYWAATSLVVSNVIGVGILTTSGFLARDLGNVGLILAAWILGGLLALCGAMSYAELGAAYPRAGGEYVYLRRAFGPAVGFLSGWTSLFVGFAGPVAAAALGFTDYLAAWVPGLSVPGAGRPASVALVWIVTLVHARGVRVSARVQTGVTFLKVGGLLALLGFGFLLGNGSRANLLASTRGVTAGSMPALAISLVFVMFSYSGWNASTYVAGEVRRPGRNIPLSVLTGTLVVTALFLALNLLYFYALPVREAAGVIRIAQLAGSRLFGEAGGNWLTGFFALSILACLSAMVVVGPRVTYAMAQDRAFPRALGRLHPGLGTPVRAMFLQAGIASVYLLTGTFEQIVTYCGFLLFVFSALAAAAVIVLRLREPGRPRPYRVPAYPWVPLLFLALCGWVTVFTFLGRPVESVLALGTLAVGLGAYFRFRRVWERAP